MSRETNDALEAAQHLAAEVRDELASVEAKVAGLALQRDRLAARLRQVRRRRDSLRKALDQRPGNGVLSVIGLCLGALVARACWEFRQQLVPDERAVVAGVLLATALALTVSRTHWARFGLRKD